MLNHIIQRIVVDERLAVGSGHVGVDYCDDAFGGFGGGEGGGYFGAEGAVAVFVRWGEGEEGYVGSVRGARPGRSEVRAETWSSRIRGLSIKNEV